MHKLEMRDVEEVFHRPQRRTAHHHRPQSTNRRPGASASGDGEQVARGRPRRCPQMPNRSITGQCRPSGPVPNGPPAFRPTVIARSSSIVSRPASSADSIATETSCRQCRPTETLPCSSPLADAPQPLDLLATPRADRPLHGPTHAPGRSRPDRLHQNCQIPDHSIPPSPVDSRASTSPCARQFPPCAAATIPAGTRGRSAPPSSAAQITPAHLMDRQRPAP